jgi:serine/threonine protein kinase
MHEATWQTTRISVKKLAFLDMAAATAAVEPTASSTQQLDALPPSIEMQQVFNTFLEQCQIHAQLQHPNIVQFIGVAFSGIDKQPRLLLTERMPQGPLTDALYPNSTLGPLQRRLSVMIDIARALAYLHSHTPPIVHLHLNPDNVLLDTTGRAKLAYLPDYQTLRSLQLAASSTSSATDNHLYMAPEIRQGNEAATCSRLECSYVRSLRVASPTQLHTTQAPSAKSNAEHKTLLRCATVAFEASLRD